MKSVFDRLNLRPGETRLVVGVGAMLFFVVNLWFVFPHFSDLSKAGARMAKARKTRATFETEIAQIPFYQTRLKELESENLGVPMEEQNLHFANTREAVAAQAGVVIQNTQRIQTRTNQFFVELSQAVSLVTKEDQLVNFLYDLGSGNSLIRVRDLSLRPDPPRQQLAVSVKLAASYPKKPAPRSQPPTQVAGSQSVGKAPSPAATPIIPKTQGTSTETRKSPALPAKSPPTPRKT